MGCQSLITHCAIINKEVVVDEVVLRASVYCIKIADSSQKENNKNRGRKKEDVK